MGGHYRNGVNYGGVNKSSDIAYKNSNVEAALDGHAGSIESLSETKADVSASGNAIQFDEDNSLLYLKNANGQVISQTHIEAGGVSSIIHIDTHEDEWKANELVTVEIEDDTQTYQGHFDANGDYFHKVSTIGLHTVRVIDTDGQIYSSTVNVEVIGGVYYKFIDKTLPYMEWLVSGGLSRDAFGSLDEILADEVTVRRLMTIHASVDYMIEWIGKDADVYAKFLASTIALKWIGLRDYAYDHMPSEFISAWLNGDNWELALKDHVPTMTADNAPYGIAFASSKYATGGRYEAFHLFDSLESTTWASLNGKTKDEYIGYTFTTPIKVRKIGIGYIGSSVFQNASYKLQGSNDGSVWEDIDTINDAVHTDGYKYNMYYVNNNNYYLSYRIVVISSNVINYEYLNILQFYGRSLNVSVPTMTSNNAPYGECFGDNVYGSFQYYNAFDKNISTGVGGSNYSTLTDWHIGYKFNRKELIKMCAFNVGQAQLLASTFKIFMEASNDGVNWTRISDTWEKYYPHDDTKSIYADGYLVSTSTEKYQYYRLASNGIGVIYKEINFFGTDYSEREFADGSTMKYLYDHGLELVELTYDDTFVNSTEEPFSAELQWSNNGNALIAPNKIGTFNNNASALVGTKNAIDFTPINTVRAFVWGGLAFDLDVTNVNGLHSAAILNHRLNNNTGRHRFYVGDPKYIGASPLANKGVLINGGVIISINMNYEINEWWLE